MGDNQVFWTSLGNETYLLGVPFEWPTKKVSEETAWAFNPSQYLPPAQNGFNNLGWLPRQNYDLFNDQRTLLGVGSDALVFDTPDSQTVIAPISDPDNNIYLAVHSERHHEPFLQNFVAQTNGLSLMFNTGDKSFMGFTGGFSNTVIPHNDGFNDYTTPSLIWTFKFGD